MVTRLLRGALNHSRGHLASQQLKRFGTDSILVDSLTKLDNQIYKGSLPCRVELIEAWPCFATHSLHARQQGRFLRLRFIMHKFPLVAKALSYSVSLQYGLQRPAVPCAGAVKSTDHQDLCSFRADTALRDSTSQSSSEQSPSHASKKDMMAVFTCNKCGRQPICLRVLCLQCRCKVSRS